MTAAIFAIHLEAYMFPAWTSTSEGFISCIEMCILLLLLLLLAAWCDSQEQLMFLYSTFFIGLGLKFLDNGSQPSLNESPQNLHTSKA